MKRPKQFFDAESHLKELESSRGNLKRESETCNKSIQEKAAKIDRIRNEIQRLQEELIEVEQSQHEDYNKHYELENQTNRYEIELKDAKDRLNEAKTPATFTWKKSSIG